MKFMRLKQKIIMMKEIDKLIFVYFLVVTKVKVGDGEGNRKNSRPLYLSRALVFFLFFLGLSNLIRIDI